MLRIALTVAVTILAGGLLLGQTNAGVSIGQIDPTSPTGATYTQIFPTPPTGPITLCGSASNAVFSFCNFTETTVSILVSPPSPYPPIPLTIGPGSCLFFTPTWIAPTSITVNGSAAVKLVNC